MVKVLFRMGTQITLASYEENDGRYKDDGDGNKEQDDVCW